MRTYKYCDICKKHKRSDKFKYHSCIRSGSACKVSNCTRFVGKSNLKWHMKKYHPLLKDYSVKKL